MNNQYKTPWLISEEILIWAQNQHSDILKIAMEQLYSRVIHTDINYINEAISPINLITFPCGGRMVVAYIDSRIYTRLYVLNKSCHSQSESDSDIVRNAFNIYALHQKGTAWLKNMLCNVQFVVIYLIVWNLFCIILFNKNPFTYNLQRQMLIIISSGKIFPPNNLSVFSGK